MSDFLGGDLWDLGGGDAGGGGDTFDLGSVGDAGSGGGDTFDLGGGSSGGSSGGFWTDLVKSVANPSTLRGILGAGTQLLGTGLVTSANNQAAETAGNAAREAAAIQAAANLAAQDKALAAQKEARGEYRAAADRGIGYIDKGVADYGSTIAPLLTPAPVTLPTYRGLTTQQRLGEQDLLRSGNATLAASGLRGAGRAGVGALMDQDRRYIAAARDANDAQALTAKQHAQDVANTSRTGLAQVQAQAGGSKANTELLTGNQLGSSLQAGGNTAATLTADTGRTSGNAVNQAGQYAANAGTANAGNMAGALGSVAGAFATPYTLGAGTPNAPGTYGAGGGTGYVDDGSFEV